MDKAAKADTKSFDYAGNSPGLYDFSKISDPLNRLHGSFVPEDVPDAASEKDLVNLFFFISLCFSLGMTSLGLIC